MSAVRLRVTSIPPLGDIARTWVAELRTGTGNRPMPVGHFTTWDEAIREGCVAGRLQAAGISWSTAPPPPELQQLEAVPGDPLPPLPDDTYPPGAIPLEELPADAVGRSLPAYSAESYQPSSMTYGGWKAQRDSGAPS